VKLRHLINAVVGEAWVIMPDKLAAIADVLEFQAAGGVLSPTEVAARIGSQKSAPTPASGIAVLPLYGLLGHRMNQVQDTSGPGGTSTEQFAAWFDSALADPAIGAIVIDIDSPGGAATGTPELAERIYRARGVKPIVAIANGLAASGAFWIACAAEAFWVIPSGSVGNIGVYGMHIDRSARNEKDGFKPTYISAGKYKVENHPDGPLTEEGQAAWQARIETIYTSFVKGVAKYRGVSADDVRNGFGEGRVLLAKDALAEGMVDRIGTLDDLLKSLAAGKPVTGARSRASLLIAADSATGVPLAASSNLALAAAAPQLNSEPAGVAAAPTVVPIHAPPAQPAKELTMTDAEKAAALAAEKAAQEAAAAVAAEQKRRDDLIALAGEFDVPLATLQKWTTEKTSVETAQRELMAAIKGGHAAKPALTPIARVHAGGDQGTEAGPFRNLGEQLHAVVQAGMPGGRVDNRLYKVMELAGPTGGNTSVGADGGFLVQKDFAVDLMKEGTETGILTSRCSETEIGPNADGLETVIIDEKSRQNGSRWGGVQVYRRDEAETVGITRPKLDKWECRIEDLMGVAWLTERALKDATALSSVYREAFRDEFGFKGDDEVFRGNGVGQCLGVMNSPALITVNKEGSQANDTVVAQNIMKMWNRVPVRSRARGAWFINIEVEPQLEQMFVPIKNVAGTENVGGWPVYTPPGGLADTPYGRLYSRPVIPIEHAEALGDKGDICYLDLSQYKIIRKGGIEEAESIHVRFVYAELAMRWLARFNGMPKLNAPLTPYKGSTTTSPFVTLQAR